MIFEFFRARYAVYESSQLHYFKFSISHFFFYYPISILFLPILYHYYYANFLY